MELALSSDNAPEIVPVPVPNVPAVMAPPVISVTSPRACRMTAPGVKIWPAMSRVWKLSRVTPPSAAIGPIVPTTLPFSSDKTPPMVVPPLVSVASLIAPVVSKMSPVDSSASCVPMMEPAMAMVSDEKAAKSAATVPRMVKRWVLSIARVAPEATVKAPRLAMVLASSNSVSPPMVPMEVSVPAVMVPEACRISPLDSSARICAKVSRPAKLMELAVR